MDTFISVVSYDETKKVTFHIAHISSNGTTYHKKAYEKGLSSLEHNNILGAFVTLGLIEELKVKQATIIHNANSLDAPNLEVMFERYPQSLALHHRLERLKKKGFNLTLQAFTKRKHDAFKLVRLKLINRTTAATLKKEKKKAKAKEKTKAKALPKPSKLDRQLAIVKHLDKLEELSKRFPTKPPFALVTDSNHVVHFITKPTQKKLVRTKKAKMMNSDALKSAFFTYETPEALKWLNVKQLNAPSWKIKLDGLLPKRKRKYVRLITQNYSFSFIIAKEVAHQLVAQKAAEFTSSSCRTIVLLYSPTNFRKMISTRDQATCQYCQTKDATTIEHIHPTSKGGLTTPDNCILCCVSCNSLKGNLDIHQFVSELKKIKKKELDKKLSS